MQDESGRKRIIRLLGLVVRWWARGNRQLWLVTLTTMLVTCALAIAIPAARPTLMSCVAGVAFTGWWSTESRRSRREREALAARLALLPRDDVPAEVVGLVLAGKKIQAIKRYRQLTGAGLVKAKAVIDAL